METTNSLNSIFRMTLTLLGSFVAGHLFFGHIIDNSYWQEIAGSILALTSIVWGVREKAVNEEKLISSAKQVMTFGLGIVTAHNWITLEQSAALGTFLLAVLPLAISEWQKRKNQKIASGQIKFSQLTGVEEKHIEANPFINDNVLKQRHDTPQ